MRSGNAHVELDHDETASTLMEALTQKVRNQTLLYNAREKDTSSIFPSYRDLLDFIEGLVTCVSWCEAR